MRRVSCRWRTCHKSHIKTGGSATHTKKIELPLCLRLRRPNPAGRSTREIFNVNTYFSSLCLFVFSPGGSPMTASCLASRIAQASPAPPPLPQCSPCSRDCPRRRVVTHGQTPKADNSIMFICLRNCCVSVTIPHLDLPSVSSGSTRKEASLTASTEAPLRRHREEEEEDEEGGRRRGQSEAINVSKTNKIIRLFSYLGTACREIRSACLQGASSLPCSSSLCLRRLCQGILACSTLGGRRGWRGSTSTWKTCKSPARENIFFLFVLFFFGTTTLTSLMRSLSSVRTSGSEERSISVQFRGEEEVVVVSCCCCCC